MEKSDIGLIGLAVMGQNLVMNMSDHGFQVSVYNRTHSKVDAFVNGEARGHSVIGTYSIEELVSSLKRPRRVMMMIKAGKPVDMTIDSLIPYLEPGDIIIDGGTRIMRILSAVWNMLLQKGCTTSGQVFPVEKRAPVPVLPSCRWFAGSMALREGHFSGCGGQGGRRCALL